MARTHATTTGGPPCGQPVVFPAVRSSLGAPTSPWARTPKSPSTHLLLLAGTHQLHHTLHLPLGDRVVQGGEGRGVDLHIVLPMCRDGFICQQKAPCIGFPSLFLHTSTGSDLMPAGLPAAHPTLTFGEAHGPDWWVAEDNSGDVAVVQMGILLAPKEPVRQLPPGRDGHCGEAQGA